ncbi:MAG: hypothetical protein QOG69_1454, partial [Actinomycetota bacterium]|nr:hypothetical protein [Actinomycetota bacterium]
MTTTELPAPAEETVRLTRGRSVDPTIRQRWRRGRVLVAAGLAVIAGAIVVGLGSSTRTGDLDPRSFEPSGSHAISALLSQRDVQVVTETDARVAVGRATSGTTLVVVHPDLLSSDDLHAIAASRADLVVVGAQLDELQSLGFPVSEGFGGGHLLRDPACSLAAARVAGNAEIGGNGYTVPDGGLGCYPENDSYGLVTFTAGGRRVTLLSDGTPLTNTAIGHSGNAALAHGLLDIHPDVGWLVPPPVAAASGRTGSVSVTDLLPDRLKAAVVQLVIAVIVIALWRGRRLG